MIEYKQEYEQLVAARRDLLAELNNELELAKPDSLAHDQQLVIKRDRVRMRIYAITKRLNEIQHRVLVPPMMVEVRSRGSKEWVAHSIELASYLTSTPIDGVRLAADSGEQVMAGNFYIRHQIQNTITL